MAQRSSNLFGASVRIIRAKDEVVYAIKFYERLTNSLY